MSLEHLRTKIHSHPENLVEQLVVLAVARSEVTGFHLLDQHGPQLTVQRLFDLRLTQGAPFRRLFR